jgi:RND family efflux transporter MFP subunit
MNKNSSFIKPRWKLMVGAMVVAMIAAAGFSKPTRARLAALFNSPAGSPPAFAAPAAEERKILYYEDPMHPWYRSDKPGIAPDCGMKLVPVYAPEAPSPSGSASGSVQISPARQQLMGLTTARAEYRSLDKTIRTVGNVTLDETRLAHVHVKVTGWIQRVFVDYTWQQVKKGDPLFTLYSPDLLASEQEYLLALKAERELGRSSFREVAAGGKSLLEAARRRLSLWDLAEEQIRQLEETGQPQREVTFYSPISGYVLERKAFPNQYVTPETEIYQLADLSTIWVQADIYESEIPDVKLGQEATLTAESLPGLTVKGPLVYIYPEVRADTRTLAVRMEFPNPELRLKPGMFVNVELHQTLGWQLAVPLDAVLDSGRRQIVFVDRGNGTFEPRAVRLGERTETAVAILGGLRAGDKVVTRANFLIDSESNLRQAIAGMAEMPGMQPAAPASETKPKAPQGAGGTTPEMTGMDHQGQEIAPESAPAKGPQSPQPTEHRGHEHQH